MCGTQYCTNFYMSLSIYLATTPTCAQHVNSIRQTDGSLHLASGISMNPWQRLFPNWVAVSPWVLGWLDLSAPDSLSW